MYLFTVRRGFDLVSAAKCKENADEINKQPCRIGNIQTIMAV